MLDKISKTGTPAFLNSWLYSFLQDRQQRVKIGDSFSEWTHMNAGVPQGTLLGPLTFLIHINDLNTDCSSIKYVDDTTLWEACSLSGNDSCIQHATDQALQWCNNNNMKINTDKTKEMIVYFGKKTHTLPEIKLNCSDLERVKQSKLLGVIINDKLTWGDHIDYICTKASKRLYFF